MSSSRRNSATLWVRDIPYQVAVDDDGADPLLVVFRNDEDEPIVTAHLDPHANCNYLMRASERYDGHIVVREGEGD